MKFMHLKMVIILFLLIISCISSAAYKIGLGRADVTGPSVEVTFMGYGHMEQRGQGIHTRQFARTFIVEDFLKNRIVFVSVDVGMISHVIRRNVVKELQKKYGNMYNYENVMISGTHTHSGPSGFHMFVLYDLPSLGYCQQTFFALVRGITQSIINAHNSMFEGRIFISETEINNASINRSPSAYDNNPTEEKAQYKDNVDKTLIQLQFMDKSNSNVMGSFNWFPVHPTSMNNTNKFISSDNAGYASVLLEKEYNKNSMIGRGSFVGAFCSSNLGDVSPNINGPKCLNSGLQCDKITSACPDKDQCVASGPGDDIFESTKIIASRIYEGASKLLQQKNGREITGSISFIHQFVDMSKTKVQYFNRKLQKYENVTGCAPALGYSFAAGTTDGPGAFDFKQGTVSDNPFWNAVRDFIAEPSAQDIQCHHPKPILLATGRADFPYPWQPTIVPTQIFLIGDVVLLGLPGEFTTMAGRRIREEMQNVMKSKNKNIQTILCGLSNSYSSYVTTPEEYSVQRYEGASTIFGPYTLPIYIQQYANLLNAMEGQVQVTPGPLPPDQDSKQISLITEVYYDGHAYRSGFGYVVEQPKETYSKGSTVSSVFVAGNPRNNLMTGSSFFFVEKMNSDGNFTVVATDADWETLFKWTRTSMILGRSEIKFIWTIPEYATKGEYRITHKGFYKHVWGTVNPYQGSTRHFTVND